LNDRFYFTRQLGLFLQSEEFSCHFSSNHNWHLLATILINLYHLRFSFWRV